MKKIFGILVIFCLLAIVGCVKEDDEKPPKVKVFNNSSYDIFGVKLDDATFLSLSAGSTTSYEETSEGNYFINFLVISNYVAVQDSTIFNSDNFDFNAIREEDGTWEEMSSFGIGEVSNEKKYTIEITADNQGRYSFNLTQN